MIQVVCSDLCDPHEDLPCTVSLLLHTLLHFGEGRTDMADGVSGECCTIPLPQSYRGQKTHIL